MEGRKKEERTKGKNEGRRREEERRKRKGGKKTTCRERTCSFHCDSNHRDLNLTKCEVTQTLVNFWGLGGNGNVCN